MFAFDYFSENFLIGARLWEGNGSYVGGTKLRGWVERELRL